MTSVESNGKEELRDLFELDKCVNWIKKNNYTKVCLQFPDSLLSYSVDIALYIDKETNNKTFILGDTSYGSCCVDEVASRHVQGDAIIHFGHACLTNNNSIPVLYILTKKCLNVLECIDKIKPVLENGDTLILYDSGYSHLRNEIVQSIPERFKDSVVVSELVDGSASKQFCGKNCCLHDNKDSHSSLRFSRGFCGDSFKTAVYIGCDSLVDNFVLMLKDVQFYQYKESSDLCVLNSFQAYKKISFLIEKIKDAKKVGLIVGTLSVGKYLGAISHIKKLCKRRKKRVYIISVGKPTVAKLSNFPEIDVFAILSCPETSYLDSKTCMQPIVGLLELELALNENRTWDNTFSKDFRDLVEGGADFIQLPEGEPSDDLDVSLVTNKLQGIQGCTLTSQEIAVNPNMSLRTSDFSSRPRTWDGLQLTIGDTPVVKAEKGRSGTAQGYVTEGETINNCS
ncbi:2-(3-amino-3-carboxypropyl)histidine synthase subunit 2 isoform X2 [Cimex lectularius]|uniref:2-(3-amino-3-carboxypropyl)histidine synthase subunit 2 n=1 Tax=Cimex lectularius TaxID=79782 RepID=A0A8I6SCC6_CIMLE|nr:2-(3-amino-3-carboxypropyl)histidine synthase subunit 2 isoform X2 [Cimex lectularius]